MPDCKYTSSMAVWQVVQLQRQSDRWLAETLDRKGFQAVQMLRKMQVHVKQIGMHRLMNVEKKIGVES